MTADDCVQLAANLLAESEANAVPCAPVRELIGSGDIDAAYAVQRLNVQRGLDAGRRVVGKKIGLTAQAVQAQLGVDQPDYGILFADMSVNDDEPFELSMLIAARAEAEVAFVLERDLDHEINTAAEVIRATAFVLPAIEIVDSRVTNWDITITDTVADNASSARYVVGTSPKLLTELDVRTVSMSMMLGDAEVSAGNGTACLGNPVNAVVWLANQMSRRGDPLRAGDLILSGALGPMARVSEPGRYEAMISGLGSVRANFV
jgi:2-keto-4-pentenoate hydratase